AAADDPVMGQRAFPQRGRAAPGNTKRVPAIVPETAADARVHDGASHIVVTTDGTVVAECHVAEDQADRRTRKVAGRSGDSPSDARADESEGGTDTVPPVAAAPVSLVFLEEAIGDRGRSVIVQAAAERGADLGASARAGVVGAAESPVTRDGTSGQAECAAVGIENAGAGGWANDRSAARVVGTTAGKVAQKETVVHPDGAGSVIEPAATAEPVAAGPVPRDGLVADERAIRDPDVRCVGCVDAAAPGGATGCAADRLIGDERRAVDREAAGHIENAAAEPLAAA